LKCTLHIIVASSLRVIFVYIFFFFSSRRRHTRWPRDWSSDVCSSDLSHGREHRPDDHAHETEVHEEVADVLLRHVESIREENRRSEERRVGKECRSRWSPED